MKRTWKIMLFVATFLISMNIDARICEVNEDCPTNHVCLHKRCMPIQPVAQAEVPGCEEYLACVNDLCKTVCLCKSNHECGLGQKCEEGLCVEDRHFGGVKLAAGDNVRK